MHVFELLVDLLNINGFLHFHLRGLGMLRPNMLRLCWVVHSDEVVVVVVLDLAFFDHGLNLGMHMLGHYQTLFQLVHLCLHSVKLR